MEHNKKPMIVIYGPTGVGKSDLALKLAEHIPASIINADMGQLYTPLSIGTAKPDIKREKTAHSMFDILDDPRHYTSTDYRAAAVEHVQQVRAQGKFPLVVGGSGFYIQSLFFTQESSPNKTIDQAVFEHKNTHELWHDLHMIDPVRASAIHKNDRYRIVRALNIWRTTGTLPSHYQAQYAPPCPYILIWVERERNELYRRIDERVLAMIHAGWLAEAQALKGTEWEQFLRKKKIIGYDTLFDYIDGAITSLPEAVAIIAQRTRNYAKRQITFWHMLEKKLSAHQAEKPTPSASIHAINLTFSDLDLYIKQLSEQLMHY